MSVNPIDWISGLFGVERAILWQNLVQLGAIWLVAWLANRLVKLIARRIELSVDDGDDAVLSAAEKREKLGDSGLTIRTLVRTVAGSQWEAAREFQRRLKNRLEAEGIEIPTPQRAVLVRPHGARDIAVD